MLKNTFFLFLGILLFIPLTNADATYQYAKIYANPFYRESMSANTNYTSTLEVTPPDGINKVINAIINYNTQINGQTQNYTLWINGKSCNNPNYYISTTYSSAGNAQFAFDCSNVITQPGNYTITLRSATNTGVTSATLDLTYQNNPSSTIKISGTEYNTGALGKIFAQILTNANQPLNNATCLADIYYPNSTKWISQQALTPIGENGLYYYNFITPATEGIYILSASCIFPQLISTNITTTTQTDNFEGTPYGGGTGFTDIWRATGTLIYQALRDEPSTDGVAENFISFAGTFPTTIQNLTSWLIKAHPTGNVTSLDVTINSMVGTPNTQNLQYEISACQTNKTTLSANATPAADCTTPNTIVNPSANLSTLIGNPIPNQQRFIPFTNGYVLNTSMNTILSLRALNAINGTNQFWTVKSDGATPYAQFRRVLNNAATNYTYIPQINLYNQDITITNGTNCLSGNCLALGSGSIERPFSTLGATSINITFYTRTENLQPGEEINLYFYDNTYHKIYTWQSDTAETLWTSHTIILQSTQYVFNDNTKIEFQINENNNTNNHIYIDNITITTTTTNYTYTNGTRYDVIRSTNELHIDNTIQNLGTQINNTVTNIQTQQVNTNNRLTDINTTTTQTQQTTNTINATTNNIKNDTTNIWSILQGYINTTLTTILTNIQNTPGSVWNYTARNLTYYPNVIINTTNTTIVINTTNITYSPNISVNLTINTTNTTVVVNTTNTIIVINTTNVTYAPSMSVNLTINTTNITTLLNITINATLNNTLTAQQVWNYTSRNLTYYPSVTINTTNTTVVVNTTNTIIVINTTNVTTDFTNVTNMLNAINTTATNNYQLTQNINTTITNIPNATAAIIANNTIDYTNILNAINTTTSNDYILNQNINDSTNSIKNDTTNTQTLLNGYVTNTMNDILNNIQNINDTTTNTLTYLQGYITNALNNTLTASQVWTYPTRYLTYYPSVTINTTNTTVVVNTTNTIIVINTTNTITNPIITINTTTIDTNDIAYQVWNYKHKITNNILNQLVPGFSPYAPANG